MTAVWIDQERPVGTPLHQLTREVERTRSVFARAWDRWVNAVTRIDHRLSRRELLALFHDMKDAEVQRDAALDAWAHAFDTELYGELRVYDPTRVRAQWVAHGESLLHACRRCFCRKSGHVLEPNAYDECCSDERCLCHDNEGGD